MPPHQLQRRARLTVSTGALIAILVGLLVVIIFCLGVLFLMWKRKRTLAARQRDLTKEQSQPFVAQGHEQGIAQPIDQRAYMGMHEGGPIELHGGVVGNAQNKPQQPQQLDGFAAPATAGHDGRPMEMEASEVKR